MNVTPQEREAAERLLRTVLGRCAPSAETYFDFNEGVIDVLAYADDVKRSERDRCAGVAEKWGKDAKVAADIEDRILRGAK